MTRIHIVTDSSVRFPKPGFIERNPITLAPVGIRCGLQSMEDRPDTEMMALHSLLEECTTIPKTEVFSVDQITDIYGRLQKDTNQILSIHTSSSLSDSFVNAQRASKNFLGRTDIQVIDSQTASIGLGLTVQAASEAIEQGADLEELVRLTRKMIPRLYMVFFLDDLFYLEQNDLISRSQAILGNMLGIIPFLTLEGGHMIPMEKVRSRTRAIEKLIEFVYEFASVDHLAILQESRYPTQESMSITDRLRAVHPNVPISISSYGPCLSTYVGAGALGIAVLESEEEAL